MYSYQRGVEVTDVVVERVLDKLANKSEKDTAWADWKRGEKALDKEGLKQAIRCKDVERAVVLGVLAGRQAERERTKEAIIFVETVKSKSWKCPEDADMFEDAIAMLERRLVVGKQK